ncbi:MAG: hypothetical protein JWQ71_2583 [Pedosphaera sp.]|nr:hypothetical protein [Pedosphaera sp.]
MQTFDASKPGNNSRLRQWKLLILAAEVFVVLSWLYELGLRIAWHYNVGGHPHVMAVYKIFDSVMMPMIWMYFAAMLFLLIASPFFLKSLGATALRAWILGAVALLCLISSILK